MFTVFPVRLFSDKDVCRHGKYLVFTCKAGDKNVEDVTESEPTENSERQAVQMCACTFTGGLQGQGDKEILFTFS